MAYHPWPLMLQCTRTWCVRTHTRVYLYTPRDQCVCSIKLLLLLRSDNFRNPGFADAYKIWLFCTFFRDFCNRNEYDLYYGYTRITFQNVSKTYVLSVRKSRPLRKLKDRGTHRRRFLMISQILSRPF